MKDKIYAVLCAGCAERWEEWYDMHEFTDRPQERRKCRTCSQVGMFSEYALTRKDIPLTTRDVSPYRRGRKGRDNPSVTCGDSSLCTREPKR
jgi:hypothetical protein